METALLCCTEDHETVNEITSKSLFTQKSLVLKKNISSVEYNFLDDFSPIKNYQEFKRRKRSLDKIEADEEETEIQLRNQKSKKLEMTPKIDESKIKKDSQLSSVDWKNKEDSQSTMIYAIKRTQIRESMIKNTQENFDQPYVLDSLIARRDIIPLSKLSSSETFCCDNLIPIPTYKGKPSKFLGKERLTQLARILLKPGTPTRFLNVDATTTKRLKRFSDFICPCGYVCSLADKNKHQKKCVFSNTANDKRINQYCSLSPKRCAVIDLPVRSCRDAQQSNKTITSPTYLGIETGFNFGKIIHSNLNIAVAGCYVLKVYKCPICDFWSSEVWLFSNHLALHEPEKPFGCSACEYRSVWNSCIVRHIKLGKLRDILHKDAVVLSGNALKQRVYGNCRAFIKIPKCKQILNVNEMNVSEMK